MASQFRKLSHAGFIGLVCLLASSTTTTAQTSEPVPEATSSICEQLQQAENLRKEARYEDGLALAKQALEGAESSQDNALITEALYQISLLYYFMENHEEARAYMEIGLTHARLHSLENLQADLMNAQGVLEWKQGNLYEATAKLEGALEIKQKQKEWVSMSSIANNLGIIAYSLQRYDVAVKHYRQGLDWLGDHQNDRMRASLLSNLGESLIPLGEYSEAETVLKASLELEIKVNDPYSLAYTYFNLGELRAGQNDPEAAIDLYHKALEIQLAIENDWAAALTRLKLSKEYFKRGNFEAALRELEPGYEGVKRLNALTLLRDYSNQYAAIYSKTKDEGLARYYTDLEKWFAQRAEKIDSNKDIAAGLSLPKQPSRQLAAKRPEKSMLHVVTLALLGLVVGILVFENLRLRKQAGSASHADR